jgi:hypothetical protein
MNFTPAQRGWYLMQLGERALNANRYDQAYSYGEMARAYFSFPAGTDDDSYTVWFTYAPVAGNTLAIDFTLSTVTNTSAAPADGDIVWDFGDRPVWSHTVTTKALTSNVATLTFAGAPRLCGGRQLQRRRHRRLRRQPGRRLQRGGGRPVQGVSVVSDGDCTDRRQRRGCPASRHLFQARPAPAGVCRR